MCSVTWLLNEEGYQVFFNRDEQKSRALATPPQQLTHNGTKVLMPIDPVGKGSWISLNEHGLSLCLLNNYQGKMPEGPLLSRGLLLKLLSSSTSLEQVTEHFNQLDIQRFAPFTLLVFRPTLSLVNPEVFAFAWDGTNIDIKQTDSPLFSSGIALEEVQHYRRELYNTLTFDNKTQQTLLTFHAHHHPEHGYLSACMHREDAHTVSFTHLNVTDRQLAMSYIPGSPCHGLNAQSLNQHRYTFTQLESLIA
ncbi:hypothetical protein EK599_17180 [Vibrio sp. T187]|uniref:NRDE family protein n=1 Tax=Vibrio TaxID=662 RepID=UPI0010C9EA5E|nr:MULTISPECIES: NRDE family protein [Vibrio]MBW3697429.1 hypothetical protein [Vibrio sp. T187]